MPNLKSQSAQTKV